MYSIRKLDVYMYTYHTVLLHGLARVEARCADWISSRVMAQPANKASWPPLCGREKEECATGAVLASPDHPRLHPVAGGCGQYSTCSALT